MLTYVVRRILSTIPLLIGAMYLVHVGVSATSDPLASLRLCLPRFQEGYDRVVEIYELDRSIWVRPFAWFGDAVRGDFGKSEALGEPVASVLVERGINTAMLAIPAFLISALLFTSLAAGFFEGLAAGFVAAFLGARCFATGFLPGLAFGAAEGLGAVVSVG